MKAISWEKNNLKIIDQTKLPMRLEYIYLRDLKGLINAIKTLKVRGAPALGAAAAFGVYLGLRELKTKDFTVFKKEMDKVIKRIASSRPTARNLFLSLERVNWLVLSSSDQEISEIKKMVFKEASLILEEERLSSRRIGRYGSGLIKDDDRILTICNTGILATVDYGTALACIYKADEQGKRLKIYACETRPLLQGARLTTWELKRKGIDVTLICDNMAATLMRQGKIDKVIVGADRIALNGDTANKIGTYNLAVLAKFHRIPFYVAAPKSTFDLSINKAKDIPIEERTSNEVTKQFFKNPVAPKGIKVFNPAFDTTSASLITAIITDKGVIRPPYRKNIKRIL